jgi:hypothetical protein
VSDTWGVKPLPLETLGFPASSWGMHSKKLNRCLSRPLGFWCCIFHPPCWRKQLLSSPRSWTVSHTANSAPQRQCLAPSGSEVGAINWLPWKP